MLQIKKKRKEIEIDNDRNGSRLTGFHDFFSR